MRDRIPKIFVGGILAVCAALLALPAEVADAAVARPYWPTYQSGHRSFPETIKPIQHLLQAHGYKIKADGIFGRHTAQALRQFQKKRRLPVTGGMTAATWEALIIKVKPGSKGPAVRAVQSQLRLLGFPTKVDGIFGKGTLRAVRDFQTRYELTVDGIVGPQTWYELVTQAGLYYEDS